ncbi:hypothetical protein GCM10028798_26690 [Humibacter antri]
MRRSTFTDQPVTYAAVGATLAHDLTQHPPKGYRPRSRSIRLGSGDERFTTSARALMTWGVQRGSGVEVTHLDPGTGEEYAGVRYAADGTPERLEPHHGTEAVFDEDGHPYIANGMTAVLRLPFGPFHVNAPVRVVYVIEEEHRVGFGYGTMHGHPLSGEESFVLEQREDDSVWLTMRSFSRAAGGVRKMIAPAVLVSQTQLAKRYLRALHPVTGNPAVGQATEAEGDASDQAAAESPSRSASEQSVPAELTATDVAVHDEPQPTSAADAPAAETGDDSDGVEGAEHTSDR